MRQSTSNIKPVFSEQLQGSTLVNVLVTESTNEEDEVVYSYTQLKLEPNATQEVIYTAVKKAYSDRMIELDIEGLRAARAVALGSATEQDNLVLQAIEAECVKLRTELSTMIEQP